MGQDILKVIYVDDNTELLEIFGEIIEECGVNLTLFDNAKDAFNEIKKKPQEYDVVITDYRMPDIDGLSFIKMLQGNKYFGIKRLAVFSSLVTDDSFLESFNNLFSTDKKMISLIYGKPETKGIVNFINDTKGWAQ